jgi:hypothetical protein
MMGFGRMAMAKRGARGKSEDDLSGLFGLSCWLDRQTHQARRGLVHLVGLVYLVYLVNFVHRTKETTQTR